MKFADNFLRSISRKEKIQKNVYFPFAKAKNDLYMMKINKN